MYAITLIAQPQAQPGSVTDSVEALLLDALAHLDNAELHIRSIFRKNARVAQMLSAEVAQLRYQQGRLAGVAGLRESADLGLIPVIAYLITGGATVVGAAWAWAWGRHKEAEEVEKTTEQIKELTHQGMDPKKAAELILGGKSGVSDILSKTVVLAAIIAGTYVFMKLK